MTQRPFVLLDRDGTIVESNVNEDYLTHPDHLRLIDHAATGLRSLVELGSSLIVVTNQSAIARGMFDEARLGQIHQRMTELLADQGVPLAAIYHCPHHPDDNCNCRKPHPGMVEQAAARFGFDPAESFVVGDNACDMQLGRAVGAATVLVRTGYGREQEAAGLDADFVADNLEEAAKLIISRAGQPNK